MNNFQERGCRYVTVHKVVNSISKSTSALLPGHLLLEIRVNLYKWRAAMQLHSYRREREKVQLVLVSVQVSS